MKIDFHVHYNGGGEYLEEHLEQLQGRGFVKLVIFGDNDACLEAAERHPDLLVPFVWFDWEKDTPAAMDDYAQRGFRGVKFILPRKPYDDLGYFPIYERLQANRMIALFHTAVISGFQGEYQRKIRASSLDMRPGLLDRIARSFPDLVIVGAHLGYPWYAEACSMMRWHKNVHFDTSTCQLTCARPRYVSDGPQEYVKPYIRDLYFSGDLHPEKLLFGSDMVLDRENAVSTIDYAVRQHDVALRDLAAPKDLCDDLYGGNAHRLLDGTSRP
jgi:predicted TIM-barrel fold metal-dependent hydrolase